MPLSANELLLAGAIALIAFAFGALLVWMLPLRRLRGERDAARAELASQSEHLLGLTAERATLAGRLERLAQVEGERDEARAEIQRLSEARQRAEQQGTALATRLHEQQHAALEREKSLTEKFALLSRQLLDQQSQKLTEHNQVNIGNLLNPLREQLGEFRKRVDEVYDKENKERGALQSEIATLKNLNQRISEDAVNLTRALKGDAQTQGAWGEMVLERVLEASGLQKGRGYESQVMLADESGGRPRPDVIVHLPEGRDIVVDAKVSLTAYERYCRAADGAERNLQLSAHLASLRKHVRELADKRYADLPGVNSLEFVLMFVPVEAAYIEAVHNDDALHVFALERQVVIVTTSTLLATLRTVESLWRNADRNRNALEIADRAGKLYDKFAGFVEDVDEARARVAAAAKALDSARGKLDSGPGNLVRQVEMLRELGARASKALPVDAVERSGLEPPAVGGG
ncbi:MAG TPA: DNA recombination protein RmuC [Rudaea sp.]|jgi:DNA recombination protein RmuC